MENVVFEIRIHSRAYCLLLLMDIINNVENHSELKNYISKRHKWHPIVVGIEISCVERLEIVWELLFPVRFE